MKTSLKISKRILSLVLTVLMVISLIPMSVFSVSAVSVPQYITDISIAYSDKQANAKNLATKDGYTLLDKDLNEGAGGKYIYLGYKESSESSRAITGMVFHVGKNPPDTITHNNATFYLVGGSSEHNITGDGAVDLNMGAGENSDYIYLYITRDVNYDFPFTSLRTESYYDDSPIFRNSYVFNTSGGFQNLNSGTNGSSIYMSFVTFLNSHTKWGVSINTLTRFEYLDTNADMTYKNVHGSVRNHEQRVYGAPTVPNVNVDGYNLVYTGWRDDQDSCEPETQNPYVTFMDGTSDRTAKNFYATYAANIKVTYDINGGSGSTPSAQSATVKGKSTYSKENIIQSKPSFTIPSTVPTKSGTCGFLGWSTDKNATTAQYTAGQSVQFKTNTTLYAVYKNHSYGSDGICPSCKKSYQSATLNSEDYYEIDNTGKLMWLAQQINNGSIGFHKVKLTNDIVISNDVVWTPISLPDGISGSVFDGNGHSITMNQNLDNGTTSGSGFGLYQNCNYSTIQNLTLKGNVIVNTTGSVGGVAGSAYRTTFRNIISYMNITNNCKTGGNVGGVVGYFGGKHANGLYSLVENCAIYADISGYIAGGIVGEGWNGTQYYDIRNCAYAGNVTGTNVAGAIVGYQNTDSNTCRFTNVYWNEKDALGFYGKRDTTNQVYTNTEFKNSWQFESGEVAYLLGDAFGQILGTDKLPVLGGAKVYCGYKCDSDEKLYSNYVLPTTRPNHTFDNNGFCTVCETGYQPATDSNNDGYYEINNTANLFWFAQQVNSGNVSINAILTADIAVNSGTITATSNDAREWTPIGNFTYKYKGTFDGNNKTISGLYVNNDYIGYSGLFGHASENSVIKNVNIKNSYFKGMFFTGGVVGFLNSGKVENCSNTGVIGDGQYSGGIVGESYNGIIINCINAGKVNGSECVGGVVGYSEQSAITNCYYLNTAYAGGIDGTDVTGSAEAKTASQFASGEVAYILGDAFGQTIGTDELPVLGGAKVYQIAKCNGEVVKYSNTNETIGHIHETVKGYDATCTKEGLTDGVKCSLCKTVITAQEVIPVQEHKCDADGFCTVCNAYQPALDSDNNGYYEIDNVGKLYWFAQQVNSGNNSINGILTKDITVNEGKIEDIIKTARVWTAIGNNTNKYTGTFNGNNKTISGLCNINSKDYYGLFGYVGTNGVVKNVGIINSYFSGGVYVGGIAGDNYGTIENCYYTGHSYAGMFCGGIAGHNGNTGLIKNCFFTGVIGGSYGNYSFITLRSEGIIENCYYTKNSTQNIVDNFEGTTEKSIEAFKLGEVAYLLGDAFGQTIGTDELPVLGGAKVYCGYADCTLSEKIYSNSPVANPEHNHILGDVDLDGIVTIRDVSTLSKYLADCITLSDCQLSTVDVNGDGFISIMDATHIQMMIAGLI